MSQKNDSSYKKFILLLVGAFVLILGVTLNLVWWHEFVMIGKGVSGIVLSLAGLLVMYSVGKK